MLTLGLPLIGSHLAQIAVGVTDTLMLGWYEVEALAAVTLASSLFFSALIAGSGFAWAVMPMVAAAAERDDEVEIRRTTRMGGWLSVSFALAVMPLMWWSEPILRAIGQTPEVAARAQDYLRIVGWGLIPGLILMLMKSYLSALERTAVILWVTVAAAVLNAILNYILIFGKFGAPELGERGAAIASLTLFLVSALALMIYAVRQFPEHTLFVRVWRPDWDALRRVYRLGWPIGLTSLSETGLFTGSAVLMGWLGTVPLAAHGIAIQIASATFVVHLGLSQAATVRAGRALGRRDLPGLRGGGHVAVALSVLFSALTIMAFLLMPELLVGAFIDPTDPDRDAILALGVGLLAMAALFQLMDGAQVMALGLLRGVQDTRVPMIYAAVAYWIVGMPISYLLGFPLGMEGIGIWLGLVIGLAVAAVLLMVRFWGRLEHYLA